jgi:hypothetical protein
MGRSQEVIELEIYKFFRFNPHHQFFHWKMRSATQAQIRSKMMISGWSNKIIGI